MVRIPKLLLVCFLIANTTLLFPQLPQGFIDEKIEGPWDNIIGFVFDESGGMYAWERAGRLFRVEDGKKVPAPILDISEEVAFYGDHGMTAVTLHPDFLNNGFVYFLYAVDRHHLIYHGTAQYDPAISLTKEATIGRVTRYTLDKSAGFTRILPGSRHIMLGETKEDGVPLLHTSHGVGDLEFGTDGSLLVSTGDGSTFKTEFTGGGEPGTYSAQALDDGIIQAKEDVGSFRSQLVDSHNGKILRIHPETGHGLASNPFYDASAPASPRSRVWAMGFRNAYRMTLVPGSGSHNIQDGNPGTFYVGDVGSSNWEELNIVTSGGQNFGWPLWEGFKGKWGYQSKPTYNQDAPNPLHNQNGCSQPYFYFSDLIQGDTEDPFPFWKNPCDHSQEIPGHFHRFIHQPPALAYNNFMWNPPTRTQVGSFDSSGKAIGISIEDADWEYEGPVFDGTCIIDGVYYQGTHFPEGYKDRYYFADYNGWINVADIDGNGHTRKIEKFHQAAGTVVHMGVHPIDGCLYFVKYKSKELHKISYGTDPAPIASMKVDRHFGPSPLTVQFDATASYDLQGQPIRFDWDLGDGTHRTDSVFSHTFTTPDIQPAFFTVTLTVTDTAGRIGTETLVVSLNNTPPKVEITSLVDSSFYALNGVNLFPLQANVSDKEHPDELLTYQWQTFLHHNTHFHEEPIDTNRVSEVLLDPAGCDGETYYYRISLTVTDPAGLSSEVSKYLFPNCDAFPVIFEDFTADFEMEKTYLNWKTSHEENLEGFVVERAQDLLHFKPIGNISETGKSPYSFTDNQPLTGKNVYRLKLLTSDGKYHYSRTLVVEAYPGLGIEAFPSPTVDRLVLRFQEMKPEASLWLYDSHGKLVFSENWQEEGKVTKQVFLGHLTPDLYFYQIRNGSGVLSGKVVILR